MWTKKFDFDFSILERINEIICKSVTPWSIRLKIIIETSEWNKWKWIGFRLGAFLDVCFPCSFLLDFADVIKKNKKRIPNMQSLDVTIVHLSKLLVFV